MYEHVKDKLAMFDLDGTLYDTRKVNFMAYQAALKGFGFSLDMDFFYKKCNGRHYKVFLPVIMGDIKDIDEVNRIKKELYPKYLSDALVNLPLFTIIKQLKEQYYTAVVTTASRKNCEDILKYFGHTELFDLIISGDDTKNKKPDPEGYIKCMDYFKIDPQDAIIFEDSPTGIEAAIKSKASVFTVIGYS